MSKNNNRKRKEILKDYVRLKRKLNREIRTGDLGACGHTKAMIKHYFDSLRNLDLEARETSPDAFHDEIIDNIYSSEKIKKLHDAVRKYKKFIITTAVVGCRVDDAFYDSVKTYCRKNHATLLVLLSADPASVAGWTIDKKLANENIVFEDTALNSNIFINTIKLSAKHVDPTTGLDRVGQKKGTFIYASPKQRLKLSAVSNSKLPHALMTTGAITKPNYISENYMSDRSAKIAENDHIMGALVIEVKDANYYYYRQIQSDINGAFADIGKIYSGQTISDYSPLAIIPGDWHSGSVDPMARRCVEDITKLLKPKYMIVHDAFDSLSINHHEDNQNVLKAVRFMHNQLDLGNELKVLAKDLNELSKLVEELVIVKSNHDDFLNKYLNKGMYTLDPQNTLISLKLALAMVENGMDPLKYGAEISGLTAKNIRWLKRDEDFKLVGVQLGAHGDKGANGARGSLKQMETAYGNSISGHAHTPEILRGSWQVGTTSLLKLTYNEGASSWLHTLGLLYPNGNRQLINLIAGQWKL